MVSIQIKKLDKSARGYGRGIDNVYYPANYGIFIDGEHKGYITCGGGVRYMTLADWKVSYIKDGKIIELVSFFGISKPFTKAKEWVMKNFEAKIGDES